MHSSEVHVILVAHQRRHHHVRAVQRVHLCLTAIILTYEIRGEGGALSARQHRQDITNDHLNETLLVYLHLHILHGCGDVVHVLLAVGLYYGETQRGDPAHRAVGVGDLLRRALELYGRGDLVQPGHDGGRALVGDTDGAECEAGQVDRQRVQHVVIEVDLLVVAASLHST